MEVKRRTQAERSATTRSALIDAARRLWAERGYAEVGTPEIAKEAGVTRGAMYHQFADKAALFAAVVDAVEGDVTRRLVERVASSGATTPGAALRAATDVWLDESQVPEVRQIILLDGAAVLGWDGLRDVLLEHGLGLTEQMVKAAIDAGELPDTPVRPFAHVLIGALDEAALYIATAEDPKAARAEVGAALHVMLDGLLQND
jgi:AcrR family transcriptional regulator